MELPVDRANRLVQTSYDNMYVEIHTLNRVFKFPKPMINYYIDGLRDKCVQQALIFVNDNIEYIVDQIGTGTTEWIYWTAVKTALEAM
jgi:hypothetical protein